MKKTTLTLLVIAYAFISQAQRNVILIIADDVGTDYLGFYEDHAADTIAMPNIRTLLSKGVRFKNATSYPLCSATRSSIFTGRYSFRRAGGLPVGQGYVDSSEISIPRLLNIYDPNIAKAQVGKFQLFIHPSNPLLNPNIMGYDYYAGNLDGAVPDYFNWTKITNGVASTVTNYATTETANDAIAWIQAQTNKPFFLWLAFNAAHQPFHLPAAGLYSDTTLTGTATDIKAHKKKYFKAMVEAMDHEIGRLFDSLQVLNKLDSTDIIFIGDNGDQWDVSQAVNPSHNKGTIYQEGVDIPFIISGPSVVNPGRVSPALVNTVDLFPTILELLGDSNWQSQIPLNKPVDGKSIMPVILNTGTTVRPWAFTERFMSPGTDSTCGKAIRNIGYKLLNFDYGKQEFYNLTNDSSESNDLLKGALSSADVANYNYLCTEMTNLIGTGNYCNAIPTITITASATTICSGANVTFSSTVANGGISPIYHWKKNGNNVGTNSSSYSNGMLASGDVISCLLTTAASTSAISNAITMTVSTAVPSKPGVISGTQYNLCNATNKTYSVSSVSNATSYIWSVPPNATLVSGQGTNSIVVNYSPFFKHGTINVQSSNYCGVSALRTRSVYAKTTAPGAIAGPNSVCTNQNVSYSVAPVAGATSYKWTLPTGSSIKSGSGTTSIDAKIGSMSGNITVLAKNVCASSAKSTLAINITCRMADDLNGFDQDVLSTINPFTDKIILSVNSDISNATVSLLDLTGREICIWKNISLPADEQQNLSIDKNVPVGIYLLKIKTSKVYQVSKINHL